MYSTFLLIGGLLEAKERGRKGSLKVAAIYFSSAIFSILATSTQGGPKENRSIEGASAGAYGLIGAHIGKYRNSAY